jgi:nicotinic acid mononucleotide adenylyltransferase
MVAVERKVAALDVIARPAVECFTAGARLRTATRIGLFPGSYNPLTYAHVAVADAAREQAQLDDVVWALARVTVDKERVTRASVPDRLAQLVAFAHPRRETVALMNRGLYVNQVQALGSVTTSGARVYVIVGYDKVVQIFDPRYYADREAALTTLFAQADLLVAPRDLYGASDLAALLSRPENQRYAAHVTALRLASEHRRDSSTEVRALATEPGRNHVALARLVSPEGLALIATGAYAASAEYPLRQDWLAALAPLGAAQLRWLPAIPELIAWIQRLPSGGQRLREAADAGSAPLTRNLLRAMEPGGESVPSTAPPPASPPQG